MYPDSLAATEMCLIQLAQNIRREVLSFLRGKGPLQISYECPSLTSFTVPGDLEHGSATDFNLKEKKA